MNEHRKDHTFIKWQEKKLEKKGMATSEPHPAKSYFIANGRFSYSGSHMQQHKILLTVYMVHIKVTKRWL